MENLQIRRMHAEDLARVVELEARSQLAPWGGQRLAGEYALPQSRLTVAAYGETLAGYLCAWEIAGELEIHNVVTAPEFRRRGVAAALLEELLGHARSSGVFRVLLEVRTGNAAAIALYQRFGFVASGLRRGYYADGEDAMLMELSLN